MAEIRYTNTSGLKRVVDEMSKLNLFRPDEQTKREIREAYQRPVEGLERVADLYRDEQHESPFDYKRFDFAPAA